MPSSRHRDKRKHNSYPNINAHKIVVWKNIVAAYVTTHQDIVRKSALLPENDSGDSVAMQENIQYT